MASLRASGAKAEARPRRLARISRSTRVTANAMTNIVKIAASPVAAAFLELRLYVACQIATSRMLPAVEPKFPAS
jgi:hypothetical protein